jgi:tricarballylate dehydrogenase
MTPVDVVVVGAGNAALVAALAAHEAGARVLVLEAASRGERGGNSRFSGGIFRIAHHGLDDLLPLLANKERHDLSRVSVAPYPREQYREDLVATSGNLSDGVLIGELVDRSYATVDWMAKRGVAWELAVGKLVDPSKLGPDEAYVLPPGGALRAVHEGIGLVECLFRAIEGAGIEIWYDAPAQSLLTTGSTIEGVRVRRRDKTSDVRGKVVLASGGFEANPEMRRRYLGGGWDLVKVRGTRFNMGTMLRQALEIGAQPAGHWGGCHASPVDADAPAVGDLAITDKTSRYSYPYGILVNVEGDRFIDEGENHVWLTYAKTGAAIRAQPRARAFQLFDQKTLHLLEPRYVTATPVEAGTIRELADRLGIPARKLEQTVAAYNASVPDGEFDPFRLDGLATDDTLSPPKSNWAVPLDEPPFVAYAVTCGITFTYGGLKIDERAQVLDTEGVPMPGLFATGEITGGFFFHNYPAGSGLMRGAVFGRIAGASAAAARTAAGAGAPEASVDGAAFATVTD